MSGTETGYNGVTRAAADVDQHAIGSDEHRIETARWVLEIFEPDAPIYKDSVKVLRAYLSGKPLPKA